MPVTVIDGQTVIGFDRPRLEGVLAAAAQGPSLGAAVGDAARITRLRGLPPAEGAFVGGVKPGSAAQRLGLATGDIITEINGRPVKSPDDLEHAISGLGSGNRILLVYLRDGNRRAAEGTL